MNITSLDALRVIQNNAHATFTFPLYDVLSHNTKTTKKLPTLVAGSETIRLMNQGVAAPNSHYGLIAFLRDLWEDIAAIEMNGKVISQREAYGKPMLALDETLFKPDAYEKLIEADLVAEKTGREIVVGDLTEEAAASLMRGFIRSQGE